MRRFFIYSFDFMQALRKIWQRVTPWLIMSIYLMRYTYIFFTAKHDPHGFLFLGGIFGLLFITVFIIIDYGMWKFWRGKWHWLWLTQIAIFVLGYFVVFK
jgi:hypothetical protein